MTKHHSILNNDERAEVGIGTMIVFIATILVSAVAAGVLINTAQKLQAKSQQTGNEATQNVASALNVVRVDGVLSAAAGDIDQLDLTINLASGADPVDLSDVVILLDTGSSQVRLTACAAAVTDEDAHFAMTSLRGGVASCGVMNAGDLVQLHLGKADATTPLPIAGGIATAEKISISLIPNHGTTALIGFTTPDGFGDATRVSLF